jgi:uncharacterized OB-fold protein
MPKTHPQRERVPSPRLSFMQQQQAQVACDNCGAQLVAGAAYCERCGARTRKARRLVRLAIRVELLFFLLVVILVIAFTWIYAVQK